MRRAGAFSLASLVGPRLSPLANAAESGASSRTWETVRNRAPLAPNAFYLLPLGSIRPKGWLYRQLRVQANGLGGHLDETWADVGPNSGWLGGTGESWERGPYFLDGLVPLAYVLDDAGLKAKAQRYIDWTLENQAASGMIGPASNDDWWPRMVMLKVLTQYQEATTDPRVIPVLSRYFTYQLEQLPQRPLRDWGKYRWQDEILSVLWLYNRIGDTKLLDLAHLLHQQGHDWRAQFANFQFTKPITPESIGLTSGHQTEASLATHGVNNAQALKASPVWSMVSGLPGDRNAIFHQLDELDRYHGLVTGIFSADEHFAGRSPSQGTELCTVVEAMFSLEQSLAIVGDARLGDRLERIAFNALPGAFTDDMWAHQYNQEANQVECSLHHKPWTTDGPESNLYGLDPNFGCCTANFHQGWPKFTASLVMLTADDGLALTAYAPCEAHTVVRGVPVHLIEETEYPFRGRVSLTIHPAQPLAFPLRLRIPGWAHGTTMKVNSEKQPDPDPERFAIIERTWRAGDRIELEFPLQPKVSRWYNQSVALERGPLVFSYGIGENWLKLRDRDMTADWQVYPATQWNYALAADANSANQSISVVENPAAINGEAGPFTRTTVPVQLNVKARKFPEWQAEDGVAQPVPQSPVESRQQPDETLSLIPYAAAKLRITCFPELKKS
ncbi:MAG: beta-L-arabinofuranosidase domain-containing protein [Acidobacteriaceae bacterium]